MLKKRELEPDSQWGQDQHRGYNWAAGILLRSERTINWILSDVERSEYSGGLEEGIKMAVSDWIAARQYYMDVGASKSIKQTEGVL